MLVFLHDGCASCKNAGRRRTDTRWDEERRGIDFLLESGFGPFFFIFTDGRPDTNSVGDALTTNY